MLELIEGYANKAVWAALMLFGKSTPAELQKKGSSEKCVPCSMDGEYF